MWLWSRHRSRPTRLDEEDRACEWDAEALRRRVSDRYRKLIGAARTNSPYYRELWNDLGSKIRPDPTIDQLSSLPFLTKSLLKRNYMRLMSERLSDVVLSYSSASTGSVTVVTKERDAIRRGVSGWRRLLTEVGVADRGVVANVLPFPSPRYIRPFRGDTRLRWLELGWMDLLAATRSRRDVVDAILAPPAVLAHLAQEAGTQLVRVAPVLLSSFERLDWATRRSIEAVVAIAVFDAYAASEVTSLIAFECRSHRGLHVNQDSVFVEIIREDGRPADAGELGEVVVTDLLNTATPIIRYRLGDLARLSIAACPCGRSLPLLTSIDGRLSDTVILSGGGTMPAVEFLKRLSVLPTQFRTIVQEDVTRFEVYAYEEGIERSAVKRIIEETIGQPVEVSVRPGSDWAGAYRGKVAPFICRVPRPQHWLATQPPKAFLA